MATLYFFAAAFSSLAHPRGAFAQEPADSCPQSINVVGEDPGNWTSYNDWDEFLSCNEQPRLFTLNDLNFSDAADSLFSGGSADFQACTSSRGREMQYIENPWLGSPADYEEVSRNIRTSWSGSPGEPDPEETSTALGEMSAYFALNSDEDSGNDFSLFAQYRNAAVGVYVGERVHRGSVVEILQEGIFHVLNEEIGGSFVFQFCEEGDPSMVVGLFVDTRGGETGLAAVLEAVDSWERGDCVPEFDNSDVIQGVDIWVSGADSASGTISAETPVSTEASEAMRESSTGALELWNVSAGGSAIASESTTISDEASATTTESSASTSEIPAITSSSSVTSEESSATQNKDPATAPAPAPSRVPGSADMGDGELTSLRTPPSPNADGSCAFYFVREGETCAKIASAHDVSVSDITRFNEGKTWGFEQCEGMPHSIFICLSEGFPPVPPANLGVQCGPQVPGTVAPTDGTSLADLNPCPLNACCSQYGYCGTTSEFCEVTGDVLGASGCLSNCERGITNNQEPPEQFISVGYFESWSRGRPCLNMGIDEIDTDSFTHVHFAFGKITRELEVDMGGELAEPFGKFVKLNGTKRIVSFGGWADSNDPEISQVWRDAVTSQSSRSRFAQNLVNFVDEYDLDGVDIDWEYPAAPEIPNLSDEPTEGEGYLSLLALIRLLLPKEKSLSIAAPASYYYLKGYPIQEMAEYLDYIVYMTYDLHGQWDAGSSSAQPGCLTGDCLRSHVNYTGTIDALSLITRAGVPASKVVVGVTSYGRSFLMAEEGCTGPMCHFLGDNLSSPAKMGPCTGEAGIIANAEIDMILELDPIAETWYDNETMSNYIVYDRVQWAAYMDAETKATRSSLYRALNFGGTSDWAIDLQSFGRNETIPPEEFEEVPEGDE